MGIYIVFICFWNQPQVAIRGNAAHETSSLASVFSLGGCCLVPSKDWHKIKKKNKKLLNFLEAIVSSWKSIEFPGCLKELNSRATIPSQMKRQFGWFVHPKLLMRNLDNSEVRCFCHIQLVRDHSRTLNTLLRLHLLAGLGTPWWNVFLVLNFSCDSAHELTLCLNLYTS